MIKIDTFIAIETKHLYSYTIEQLQQEFTSIQHPNALQIIAKNLTRSKGHFLHGAILVEIDDVQITSLLDWDDFETPTTKVASPTPYGVTGGILE